VRIDALVDLFNRNNNDHERRIELGLDRFGPAAARRSRQVDRWLYDPVVNQPHEAWPILNALVEKVDDGPDGAMEYLGAYLVEEFVKLHGVEFLDVLEAAARDSARWRRVLAAARDWHNPKSIDVRVSDRLMPYIREYRASGSDADDTPARLARM
jgi:hypothetical protein